MHVSILGPLCAKSEPGSYRTGMFDTVRSTVHQDVADNLQQFSNYCGDRPQL